MQSMSHIAECFKVHDVVQVSVSSNLIWSYEVHYDNQAILVTGLY